MDKNTKKEKKVKFNCKNCNSLTLAFNHTKRFEQELCSNCFGKNKDLRPKELNDLSGAEWAKFSLSVQEYPDIRSKKQRQHGACFPISLAKQYILKYTKKNQIVLDPLIGVGTTLDACIELKRKCFGMEINKKFYNTAKRALPKGNNNKFAVFCDDVEHVDKYIKPNSIDFILTSPPYASLLKNVKQAFAFKWKEHSKIYSLDNPKPYSNKKQDLGNMRYSEYFAKMQVIMSKLYSLLREGKYMTWVVKDYRDMRNNTPYINFHGDIINCAAESNFTLWDIVIYNQTKFRPLVCLGYPSMKYYHNIGHSYILVFRKGNI